MFLAPVDLEPVQPCLESGSHGPPEPSPGGCWDGRAGKGHVLSPPNFTLKSLPQHPVWWLYHTLGKAAPSTQALSEVCDNPTNSPAVPFL